ncbi:MAG TPA: hypothetical protein VFW66_13405 [Gemmatimonadales bacterium]|nr:hypothetical protein [Gemmatimonadales bacterium]
MSAAVRPIRRLAPRALAAGVVILLAACASVTPISELLDNPSHYDGKTVRVQGEVEQAAGGLGVGAYRVKDNTGTLTVVSDKGDPPRTGAKINVKGVFQALITLGSRGIAVLKEQSRSVP